MKLNIEDIKKLIPHRKPFLFIEELKVIERGKIGESYRTFKETEYFFEGHFPGAPVMPGVLQIEAMAQAGGVLVLSTVADPENYLTFFMKIDNFKFKRPVLARPGVRALRLKRRLILLSSSRRRSLSISRIRSS